MWFNLERPTPQPKDANQKKKKKRKKTLVEDITKSQNSLLAITHKIKLKIIECVTED